VLLVQKEWTVDAGATKHWHRVFTGNTAVAWGYGGGVQHRDESGGCSDGFNLARERAKNKLRHYDSTVHRSAKK
jgi:hypothetical protein